MKNGLGNIMKQAQQMQEKLQQAQEQISSKEIIGESGAGLVKVVMNGKHEVKHIDIDNSLLDDKEMLEDLIAAAVNDANKRVEKMSQEEMSNFASGLNLPAGIKLPF